MNFKILINLDLDMIILEGIYVKNVINIVIEGNFPFCLHLYNS